MAKYRTVGAAIKIPLCEAFERKRTKDGWEFSECSRDAPLVRDGFACCKVHHASAWVQWRDAKFSTSGDYVEDAA